MSFWTGLAGAALGGITSIFGQKEANSANKQMQDSANATNIQLAKDNRDWQEYMANTAHTREVADLRKAGLNPILSGTGGSGAGTPSGGAATMNAARMEDTLGKGVSSALASANLNKDLEMADSQKALNAASVNTALTQQSLNVSSAAKMREDALLTVEKNKESRFSQEHQYLANEAQKANLAAVKEQAQVDLKKAKIDNKMATYDAINTRAQSTLDVASSVKDLINPFKGLFGGKGGENGPFKVFKNKHGVEGFIDKSGKFRTTK